MKERKKLFSRLCDLPYGRVTPYNLFDASKNSKELVQRFQLQRKVPVHNGCVNSISWNENGRYLLSGSDDQHLAVVQGYDYSVLAYIQTGHRANIFSAKFLPCSGDSHVVSSSGDGIIIYSDLERPDTSMSNKFTCHKRTAYEIMTIPNDPNTFLSCGEDKTVRWFDIRTKTSCDADDCSEDILISCRDAVTSIAVNPLIPYQLAVGCADSSVQIFDRRMLSTHAATGYLTNGFNALTTYFSVPDFPPRRRITSLCYSADGREMLVSYSSDYIYLFDIKDDMRKKPKILSSNENVSNGSYSKTGPMMKRLRVRGDWSDTGPNSRPETEIGGNRDNSPNNLVRRMTDILTRMLFSSSQPRTSSPASSSSEPSPLASFHSEDGDQEVSSDANNEEAVRNNRPDGTNNEPSTTQVSEQNESSLENGSVKNNAGNNDSTANNCAFEQTNVDTQSPISVDLPKTSGLQTSCESSTVIEDSITKSAESELPGQMPSTSSPFSPLVRCEANLSERQPPDWNSVNVVNLDSPNEHNSAEDINKANSSGVVSQNISPETSGSNTTALVRGVEEESETEAAVQSIQPSESVPAPSELQSPRSPSPEVIIEHPEEVELMMEVDSWDSDSDDGNQPQSSQSNRNNRRRGRVSSSGDVVSKDQIRKEKPPKDVKQPNVKKLYTGHRNARTMIKESTFWGDNFVMSGSDCGHIFIWDRHTTELVMVMEADHHVVNCLQPHPFDPILASSGIDYDIKIWAPLKEEPFFDLEHANEIVKRNEIMLEVTKDTITVPASFMFNMFNTLNHLRNGHRQLHRWSRAARASGSSDSSNR